MDLKSFLARTELFREATQKDNQALLDLFDRSQMRTPGERGLRLRYERSPDFFRFLSFQGDQQHVFLGESPENARGGQVDLVCSLSLRDGYQEGRVTRVGYLGDLRVHSSPRLTIAWRRAYGEMLSHRSEIEELQDCGGFLTAILQENEAALRTLVHPKKDFGYRYVPRADYRMVTLLGRLPLIPVRQSEIGSHWRQARESDRGALTQFLDRCGRTRPFGFLGESELERRLRVWPQFSMESFWIAVTGVSEEVIAAFAPWTPSPHKRILLDQYPSGLSWPFALGRWAGVPFPRKSEEMKVCYLTWLEIAPELPPGVQASLFREGLDTFWMSKRRPRDSLIAFCDFDSESLISALPHYLKLQTPLRLYEVRPSGLDTGAAASSSERIRPPGFEMALV